jgi:hypothetical protein
VSETAIHKGRQTGAPVVRFRMELGAASPGDIATVLDDLGALVEFGHRMALAARPGTRSAEWLEVAGARIARARAWTADPTTPDAVRASSVAGRRAAGVAPQRMVGRYLDEDDPYAVGVLDPHLDQAPGLRSWWPDHLDAGRAEPPVLGVQVAHLQPERDAGAGRLR